jgi:tetratricopeptide (TPR) repeat protein
MVALLAYANSLRNGFVWDDPIILSRQLVVFRSAADVLAPPRDIPQFSPDYYRPLTIASYLLDRAVGGTQPFAFHFSVVLAHAATSVLVYLLALQLVESLPRGDPWPRGKARDGADRASAARERGQTKPAASVPGAARAREPANVPAAHGRAPVTAAILGALAAGLLFAVHPIHTESVAWAAGRSDVLAGGFLLAALLLHGRPRPSWTSSALAGLSAAAALGAKESAVALYPLMLLRDLLAPPAARRSAAEWLRGYAGPLLAGVLYVLLRRHALGEFVGSAANALAPGQRSPVDLIDAVGMYVGKLLWPVDLNAYIDHLDGGPATVVLAALLVGALIAAAWRWWTVRSDGAPLFALAWLALTLVPSLSIVWKIPDAPVAERYLYLPSVGFCLLAGVLVARVWAAASSRPARLALAGVLAAALLAATAGTVRRNPVWHDDIALWQDTEPKSQSSGMAARGLGTAYQQAGRAADARAAFERALRRQNNARGLQTIYNNLGTLAMFDGDYGAAQRHYQAALAVNPDGADTLFNLGLAVLHGGGVSRDAAQAALPYYQRALRLNPHDPDVEAALAQAFDVLGQHAVAVQHARRALELGAQGQTGDSLRNMLQQAGSPPPPNP